MKRASAGQMLARNLLHLLKMAVLLAMVWLVLTQGRAWGFGVAAVVVALGARLKFTPASRSRLKLLGLLRFSVFFLLESLRAGFDVALRALDPRLPLNPGWIYYPLRLPPGSPQVLFINAVSLLPGTLSADLNGTVVSIHTLIQRPETEAELVSLETQIADLFALQAPTTPLTESNNG